MTTVKTAKPKATLKKALIKRKNAPKTKPPKRNQSIQHNARRKELIARVCSFTDPFCHHARNAQFSTVGSTPSVPFTLKHVVNVGTNASGEFSILVLPNYGCYPYVNALTLSGGFANFSTNFSTLPILDGVVGFRITSYGIKLAPLAAPLYRSGMIHLRTFSVSNSSQFDSIAIATFNAAATLDVPYSDISQTAINLQRTDPTSRNWWEPDGVAVGGSPISTWTAPGYQSCLISGSGLPASITAMNVEFTIHYELVFTDSVGMNMLATKPPPPNKLIDDASDMVSAKLENFMLKGVEKYSDKAITYAQEILTGLGL